MFDRRDPIHSFSEPLNDHSGLHFYKLRHGSGVYVCPSLPSRVCALRNKVSLLVCSSVDAR